MRLLSWLLLAASFGIVLALVASAGLDELAELVARGGFALLVVVGFWIPQNLLATEAWRCLFPAHPNGVRPSFSVAFSATWMGTSVNTLLPVASIGGSLVKARVAVVSGAPGAEAVGSVVVDKTIQAAVVAVWSLVGATLLAALTVQSEAAVAAAIGCLLLGAGVAIFVLLQRRGSFAPLARLARRALRSQRWSDLIESAAALDQALAAAYRRRASLWASASFLLAGRFLLLGEVVVASHLLGQPIGVVEALVIRGVVAGMEAALFVVPDGLGVAEAGYVGVGALLGYPPDLMLVIALVIRARAVLPSLPGLALYQRFELGAISARQQPSGHVSE
jgi:putative membrane protein